MSICVKIYKNMSIEKKIKLKENERIIQVIHRYGLTFFWSWLIIFILLFIPFFSYFGYLNIVGGDKLCLLCQYF